MSTAPYDQVRTLYRTLLVFATVAVLILVVGLGEFLYFEPPQQVTGERARIEGVFAYEPATGFILGTNRSTFARTDDIAAVVNWAGVPDNQVVDARWFDSFGGLVGRIGPSTPAQLGSSSIVPVITPPGLHHNLPGRYTFVVERLQGGLPVEVLARRFVQVES
ncbi:MAG: hypothetical protein ACYDB4_17440 [Candidatus Dormibacteraceae bacterium]